MRKYNDIARENIRRAIERSELTKEAILKEQFGYITDSIHPQYHGIGAPSLNEHPDFQHLRLDQTQRANIVAMFVDVSNTTARSYFETLEKFHEVRKAFVYTFAEIIQQNNGFVQEFPGDGVLAYFGHEGLPDSEAMGHALIAAADIMDTTQEALNEELTQIGLEPIRTKIGVEYGEVLFSRIGNETVNRVQAEGFTVNIASKIEGQAFDWQLLIGQGIYSTINPSKDICLRQGAIDLNYLRQRKSIPYYNINWRAILQATEQLLNIA